MDWPILFPTVATRALIAGRKHEARRLASSPLAACRPGDRLWVKEPFAARRHGAPHEALGRWSPVREADFVVLGDGTRRDRQGMETRGHAPPPDQVSWAPALHLPRWASRLTLIVERVDAQPLQAILHEAAIAEGMAPILPGLWRRPGGWRLWRDPRAAFARQWDTDHGTDSERWAANPMVVALRFTVVRANIDGSPVRLC